MGVLQSNWTFVSNTSLPQMPRQFSPQIYHSETLRIAYLCSFIVIFVLSLFGNTTLIAIIYKNRNMHTNTNYLLVNMACSDIAAALVLIRTIFKLARNSHVWGNYGWFGEALCKITFFVRDMSVNVSVQSMVCIALERFFSIVYSTEPRKKFLHPKVVVPVIWVVSFGIYAFYFKVAQVNSDIFGFQACMVIWEPPFDPDNAPIQFYIFFMVSVSIVPFLLMTVLYGAIAIKLRQQNLPGATLSEIQKRRSKRNKSVIRLMAVIVAAFFVSWTPVHTIYMVYYYAWDAKVPTIIQPYFGIIFDTAVTISYSCFAINPCICLTLSANYRKGFCRLFGVAVFRRRKRCTAPEQYAMGRRSPETVESNDKQDATLNRMFKQHMLRKVLSGEDKPGSVEQAISSTESANR